MSVPTIEVHLLGGLGIKREGIDIFEKVEREKPLRLFIYLSLELGSALHRDTIMERFWGYKDQKHARDNFYSTVCLLKKVLSYEGSYEEYLTYAHNCLALNPETVTCDIKLFRDTFFKAIDMEGTVEENSKNFYYLDELFCGEIMYYPVTDPVIVAWNRRLRFCFVDAMYKASEYFRNIGDKAAAGYFYYRAAEYDVEMTDQERDRLSAKLFF